MEWWHRVWVATTPYDSLSSDLCQLLSIFHYRSVPRWPWNGGTGYELPLRHTIRSLKICVNFCLYFHYRSVPRWPWNGGTGYELPLRHTIRSLKICVNFCLYFHYRSVPRWSWNGGTRYELPLRHTIRPRFPEGFWWWDKDPDTVHTSHHCTFERQTGATKTVT